MKTKNDEFAVYVSSGVAMGIYLIKDPTIDYEILAKKLGYESLEDLNDSEKDSISTFFLNDIEEV